MTGLSISSQWCHTDGRNSVPCN